jgi:hypothetical protein
VKTIRLIVGLAAAAVALSVVSVAWGCTVMRGQTYAPAAAKAGGQIAAFADAVGGPTPADGTTWTLNANKSRGPCHPGDVSLGASARLNRSATPDLGPVTATAPLSPGSWNVCFLYPDATATGGGYSTWPAVVTVL